MNIQTVRNVSDCVPLYLPHSLYLKPYARIKITVPLPPARSGVTVSHWDLMEKLRTQMEPNHFASLKVSKTTIEYIRFDAELEDKSQKKNAISRLDGRQIVLTGYKENVRIKVSEAKDDFPTRHDWDSFFRDAQNMDEMKAGERPDTIYISNIPIRWLCPRHMEKDDNPKPSESIFKRIFEKFGIVRNVDIPICDPYRKHMKTYMTGMQTFSFDQDTYFEGYVQFEEYMGFVKAMDEFRGMMLVHKEGDKNLGANITVTFDKTKHLSDLSIKRRQIVRERLIAKEKLKEEEERKKLALEEAKKEKERLRLEKEKEAELQKQREKEERRKEKYLKKLQEKEQTELSKKIRDEEYKLLIAQRKLESMRLLEVLFERVKVKQLEKTYSSKSDSTRTNSNALAENDLRHKLINKLKKAQENDVKKYSKNLNKAKTLLSRDPKDRSPSINTISSDDSVLDNIIDDKKKSKLKRNTSSSSSASEEHIPKKHKPTEPVPSGHQGMPMPVWMDHGMYPYPPFMNPMMTPFGMPMYPFPRGGYMSRPYRNFRGRFMNRGGYNHYNSMENRYSDKNKRHYLRRSSSRSKSRSRSKGRYSRHRRRRSSSSRSSSSSYHSRSRNHGRSRRSHSSSRSRSRSRTRSKRSTDRKLVSTRRSRSVSSRRQSRSTSRRRSRTRERSKHSRSKSSRSKSSSRSRSKHREGGSYTPRKSEEETLVENNDKVNNHEGEKESVNNSKDKINDFESVDNLYGNSPEITGTWDEE